MFTLSRLDAVKTAAARAWISTPLSPTNTEAPRPKQAPCQSPITKPTARCSTGHAPIASHFQPSMSLRSLLRMPCCAGSRRARATGSSRSPPAAARLRRARRSRIWRSAQSRSRSTFIAPQSVIRSTSREDTLEVARRLNPIGGRYLLAATFGNVHGVYKPGHVKLKPGVLKECQGAEEKRALRKPHLFESRRLPGYGQNGLPPEAIGVDLFFLEH
jgi:Fructose-bisphosphate aldolase class-II